MFLIFVAGLVLTIIGYLYLSQVIADKRGLLWGLSIFVIPPVAVVYSIAYWKNARPAVLSVFAGLFVTVIALFAGAGSDIVGRLESRGYGQELAMVSDTTKALGFYVYGYQDSPSLAALRKESLKSDEDTDVTEVDNEEAVEQQPGVLSVVAKAREWTEKKPRARYKEKVKKELMPRSFQARSVYKAGNYLGHVVKIDMSNGPQRQAVLVRREGNQLVLQRKAFDGVFSFRVNIDDVSKMYVELPDRKV